MATKLRLGGMGNNSQGCDYLHVYIYIYIYILIVIYTCRRDGLRSSPSLCVRGLAGTLGLRRVVHIRALFFAVSKDNLGFSKTHFLRVTVCFRLWGGFSKLHFRF